MLTAALEIVCSLLLLLAGVVIDDVLVVVEVGGVVVVVLPLQDDREVDVVTLFTVNVSGGSTTDSSENPASCEDVVAKIAAESPLKPPLDCGGNIVEIAVSASSAFVGILCVTPVKPKIMLSVRRSLMAVALAENLPDLDLGVPVATPAIASENAAEDVDVLKVRSAIAS